MEQPLEVRDVGRHLVIGVAWCHAGHAIEERTVTCERIDMMHAIDYLASRTPPEFREQSIAFLRANIGVELASRAQHGKYMQIPPIDGKSNAWAWWKFAEVFGSVL